MARPWLPVGLVLLCVTGLILFLQGEDPVVPSGQEGPERLDQMPVEAAPDVATPLTGAGSSTAQSGELRRVRLPDAVEEVTTRLGEPVAEGGMLITVLDAETEEPLPQADVLVLDTGTADMRLFESTMATEPDFEQVFLALGTLYRTDAKAQVRIPTPVGQPFLAGRTPKHFDFVIDVEEQLEEFTLLLNPLEILPVQVVDRQGRKVSGAPVSLRIRQDERVTDLMQVLSDDEGIARLRLFALLKREIRGDDLTHVALQLLTPEPVEVPIDLQALPEHMPVLTLPDAGQVEVEILDPDGGLDHGTYLVRLELLELDAEGKEAEGVGEWDHPRKKVVANSVGGRAVFPLVALDQWIRLTVLSADGERSATEDVAGPVTDGRTSTFRITPEPVKPVLTGTLIDVDGKPAAQRTVETTIRQVQGNRTHANSQRIQTEADGSFRILVEFDYRDNEVRSLHLNTKAEGKLARGAAVVDISRPYGPGEHSLGRIRLDEPPLLVQGRVLDAKGEPLPSALVRMQQASSQGEDVRWRGLSELHTGTDDHGEFQVHGIVFPGRFRLDVQHMDFRSTQVEFALGDTGLEIQLEQAVTLSGRFLFDEGIDPDDLRLQLHHLDADGKPIGWGDRGRMKPDGSFEFPRQEQGEVRLTLSPKILEETLYRLDDLVLTGDSATHDLGEIDLRGQVQVYSLRVVDESGDPLPLCKLRSVGSYRSTGVETQPARLLTRDGQLDFHLSADGYRSQDIHGMRGDRVVRMVRGIPVRLHVTNLEELPEGLHWSPALRYLPGGVGGAPDRKFQVTLKPQGDGSWQGYVSHAGTYHLQALLSRGRERGGTFPPSEPFHIEVEENSLPQDFDYTLDEKLLEFARKMAD